MICCRLNAGSLGVISFTNRAGPAEYWGIDTEELNSKQLLSLEDRWQILCKSLGDNERRSDVSLSGAEYKILAIDKMSAYEAIGKLVVGRYLQARGGAGQT